MVIYSFLEESVRKCPEKVAIICNGIKYTYNELKCDVDKLTSALAKCNLTKFSRTAVVFMNSYELICCIFALSKIKSVGLLLNPNIDVINLMKTARIDTIITTEGYLSDHPVLITLFNCIVVKGKNVKKVNDVLPRPIENDNKYGNVFMQTSSGTTNTPKIAYRTDKNYFVDINNITTNFDYSMEDVIYCAVPIFHGYGLTMALLSSIKIGATLVLDKWFMVNRFFSLYEVIKPTIFVGSPESYDVINRYVDEKYMFKYRKWFFSSGSPLKENTATKFFNNFRIWINQMYGMMEASTISANLYPTSDNYLSVGKAIDGIDLDIINDLIMIRGEAISTHYVTPNGDELLPKVDGWFSNGDIGNFNSDSTISILGRRKD